jgi:hypothetical protein
MSEGLAGDLAQQESIVAMHLMAIASLPLRWISANADTPEVQGILYLDSTKSMHVLTGLDQKILTKLAIEAGNVFEKLEMIKGFEQRKILEQELSLAQETQKTILPHSVPHWQNFRVHAFNQPTRYLGGDFYDFLSLSEGALRKMIAEDATIARVAAKHGVTPSQVALAWLLHRDEHILLIPGTSSVAHLEENLAAADVALDADDMTALDDVVPAGGPLEAVHD